MENPIKMDDLGVSLFLETPTLFLFSSIDHADERYAMVRAGGLVAGSEESFLL